MNNGVELFVKICTTPLILGTNLIDVLEMKIDDTNHSLFEIIQTSNYLSYLHDLLPKDSNGIVFREKYNSILKEKLENKTCFTVNCFSFYETHLKKNAVNQELLKTVKIQHGGFLIYAAAIAGLSIISLLTSQVDANTSSISNFIKGEKNLKKTTGLVSEQYNFLHQNQIFGVCVQNAYIAEMTAGGICTDEEWKSTDPNAIQRMMNEYIIKSRVKTQSMKANEETLLLYGADVRPFYGESFTHVPPGDGRNPQWFKAHFMKGEKTEKAINSKATSDLAITTVGNNGHAFNILYNRNNQKLCLSDENLRVTYMNRGFKRGQNIQYWCETDFFTKNQLRHLKNVVKVVPDGSNIFEVAGSENKILDSPVLLIRSYEYIFEHDNNKNTGNLDDLVEMHEKMHETIIDAQEYNILEMEENVSEMEENILGTEETILEMEENYKKWQMKNQHIDVFKKTLPNIKKLLQLGPNGEVPDTLDIFASLKENKDILKNVGGRRTKSGRKAKKINKKSNKKKMIKNKSIKMRKNDKN
jgi:hypothetical protein